MNAQSSRSHSVFIIKVNSTSSDGATTNGRLNLVDLAGSEKVGKTGATGQTLEEAKKINQSLSALGLCINALVEKKKHIPFRDSKLTRILQESLGGNSKTTMICACSPHSFNIEETVSTLKFGQRAKSIKCEVKVNAIKSAKELQLMVEKLQHQLNQLRLKNSALLKQIELLRDGKPISDEVLKMIESGSDTIAGDLDQKTVDEYDGDDNDDDSDGSDDGDDNDNDDDDDKVQKNDVGEVNETAFAELQIKMDELKAEFEDEIAELEEELEAALDDNEELSAKVKDLEEEKLIIEEEIEALLDENELLLSQQNDNNSKAQFDLKQLQMEKEELEIELEEVLKELDEKEKELQEEKKAQEEFDIDFSSNEAIDELAKRISEPVARGKVMAELEKLRSENQLQKELISQLKNKVFSLEEALEEEKVVSIEANSDLTVLENSFKREMNAIKEELSKYKEDLRNSESQRLLMNRKYEQVRADWTSLSAKTCIAEKGELDLKNKIDELKRQIARRDEEVARFKARLFEAGVITSENSTLDAYVFQLFSTNMNEVRESADAIEKRKDETIKSLHLIIENGRLEAKGNADSLMKQIDELNSLVQLQKDTISKQQTTMEELRSKIDHLNKEIANLQGSIQSESEKHLSIASEQQAAYRKLEEHVIQLQTDLESTIVQREELRDQLSGNLSPMSGSIPKSGRNLVNEVMELRVTVRKVTYERNKLEDEANHSRKENANYRKKLKALTEKIDLQRKRIVELTSEIEGLRTEQTFKKNDRTEFKKKREELESKIAELHSALEAAQRANELRNKRSKANITVPVRSRSGSVLQRNVPPYRPGG